MRDRKHRKNRYGKNHTPKIYFGTSVSEREKTPKRDGTGSLSRNHPAELSLPERITRHAKYGKWDEILRDTLNGKLRIVQNKKRTETYAEDDDDDDDEEEIPEETGI